MEMFVFRFEKKNTEIKTTVMVKMDFYRVF